MVMSLDWHNSNIERTYPLKARTNRTMLMLAPQTRGQTEPSKHRDHISYGTTPTICREVREVRELGELSRH